LKYFKNEVVSLLTDQEDSKVVSPFSNKEVGVSLQGCSSLYPGFLYHGYLTTWWLNPGKM
jgi:hypothetical protein